MPSALAALHCSRPGHVVLVWQRDEDPLYVFERKFGTLAPELLKHYSLASLKVFPEDLFEVMGDDRPDYRWLVVGPARTGEHLA